MPKRRRKPVELYRKEMVNAKNYADKYKNEYKNDTEFFTFAGWATDTYESIYNKMLLRLAEIDSKLKRNNELFLAGADSPDDVFQVTELVTDEQGAKHIEKSTHSKSALIREMDALNEEKQTAGNQIRDRKLGAYLYAKNKVENRSIFSKIFVFWRTISENNMLKNMRESLRNEYGYTEETLNSFTSAAYTENFKTLGKVSIGGENVFNENLPEIEGDLEIKHDDFEPIFTEEEKLDMETPIDTSMEAEEELEFNPEKEKKVDFEENDLDNDIQIVLNNNESFDLENDKEELDFRNKIIEDFSINKSDVDFSSYNKEKNDTIKEIEIDFKKEI